MTNRHLFAVPECVGIDNLCSKLDRIADRVGTVKRASHRQIMKDKMSRKARRYAGGAAIYFERGIEQRDLKISAMQKLEFHKRDSLPIKECRGIQYRSVAYNYALMRWMHHVESATYLRYRNKDGGPRYMKGLTPHFRAACMAMAWEKYKDPVALLIDHKRFDAHFTLKVRRALNRLVERIAGNPRELKWLNKSVEKSVGRTVGGAMYRVTGKQVSGEVKTAYDNCTHNSAAIESVLEDECGATEDDYDEFVDGDDSVVIAERELLEQVTAEMFLKYGQESTIEMCETLEGIEFCQCRLIMSENGPLFARNPHKVLETIFQHPRNLPTHMRAGVLVAKAMSERVAQQGVPCNQDLAEYIIANVPVKAIRVDEQDYIRVIGAEPLDIQPDNLARVSMHHVWDIPPELQTAASRVRLLSDRLCWPGEGVLDLKDKSNKRDGKVDKMDHLPGGEPTPGEERCPAANADSGTTAYCWKCWATAKKPEAQTWTALRGQRHHKECRCEKDGLDFRTGPSIGEYLEG